MAKEETLDEYLRRIHKKRKRYQTPEEEAEKYGMWLLEERYIW